MEDLFTPIFSNPEEMDYHPRFNSKKTLDNYLTMYNKDDSYSNYELYIIARNKGAHHEACHQWHKDIEKYWENNRVISCKK